MNNSDNEISMEDIRMLLQSRNHKKKRKFNIHESHGNILRPKEKDRIRIYYQNIKGI